MDQSQLDRLQEFLTADASHGIVAVYLFGSHARGRVHRESDIDLGVLLDRAAFPHAAERSQARVGLISELIALLDDHRIDLVVLNDVSPELGRRIVTEGRLLFVADPEVEHAFRRDVQLLAADLDPFLRRTRAIKLERLRR